MDAGERWGRLSLAYDCPPLRPAVPTVPKVGIALGGSPWAAVHDGAAFSAIRLPDTGAAAERRLGKLERLVARSAMRCEHCAQVLPYAEWLAARAEEKRQKARCGHALASYRPSARGLRLRERRARVRRRMMLQRRDIIHKTSTAIVRAAAEIAVGEPRHDRIPAEGARTRSGSDRRIHSADPVQDRLAPAPPRRRAPGAAGDGVAMPRVRARLARAAARRRCFRLPVRRVWSRVHLAGARRRHPSTGCRCRASGDRHRSPSVERMGARTVLQRAGDTIPGFRKAAPPRKRTLSPCGTRTGCTPGFSGIARKRLAGRGSGTGVRHQRKPPAGSRGFPIPRSPSGDPDPYPPCDLQ